MAGSAQTCDDLRKANACEIIDLYPLMELRESFLSSKRYMRKSAMRLAEGLRGSIFPRISVREELPASIIDCSGGFSPCRGNKCGSPDRKAFLLQGLPDNGQTCKWNMFGSA
ncbi:hypothetical protein DPMN_136531 [Dreissena polymorpha]|uniref:Uncharacterized protein n=1 Tax=Dreissena polymorpha TaxID=45954 RepID=A0A9D4G018_DREPO|nr:hypothetical protein DPMN_136531 [Dreissena polymorpha]